MLLAATMCSCDFKKNDEFDDATNTDGADHIPFEGRGKKRNDNFVKFTVYTWNCLINISCLIQVNYSTST